MLANDFITEQNATLKRSDIPFLAKQRFNQDVIINNNDIESPKHDDIMLSQNNTFNKIKKITRCSKRALRDMNANNSKMQMINNLINF